MSLNERDRPTRRRGAELEAAILKAAWDQLAERGYGGFTFEAIAERARTSRPVLYRRWPTRADLLEATIRNQGSHEDTNAPDTGSLRGDLLASLRRSNAERSNFLVLLSARLGEYYEETGRTPHDVRDFFLGRHRRGLDQILDRAVARGEADPALLTERVRAVPYDLYRHEVLMTLHAVPDDRLESIVDEVFIPLVTPREPRTVGNRPGDPRN